MIQIAPQPRQLLLRCQWREVPWLHDHTKENRGESQQM